LYVLDRFDVLMSKIIFKKWKNIIGMHFGTKNYLKSTRNHTAKHSLILKRTSTYKLEQIFKFKNGCNLQFKSKSGLDCISCKFAVSSSSKRQRFRSAPSMIPSPNRSCPRGFRGRRCCFPKSLSSIFQIC